MQVLCCDAESSAAQLLLHVEIACNSMASAWPVSFVHPGCVVAPLLVCCCLLPWRCVWRRWACCSRALHQAG